MDESYDVCVCGTGLKECILSGLLSVAGMKVLYLDRNGYYGGESASLSLSQLYEKFRPGSAPSETLGASRDWNVDLVPKFMMANGLLVKVLVHTEVTRYLEFKAVDGSYVLQKGKVHKVPANDMEALRSGLMGLFEKRRMRNYLLYVMDYNEKDPKTWKGMDLTRMPMSELYKYWGLAEDTIDFLGHAVALHSSDNYLAQPALATVKKTKLYYESVVRFEETNSPYIYPLYGLGELPQAFARLSAVYGGTYMLNQPGMTVAYDASGKACGVTSEGSTAACKFVVGDPSYFAPEKTRVSHKVVRAICFMNHPIPNTGDSHSVQIIMPQRQTGRKSDMYVFCCSYAHNVASKGKFIAFVCATVETDDPVAELRPALALLGPVEEQFFDISEVREPVNDPSADGCFITKGYDATTHFESTVVDCLELYKKITGKELDLTEKELTQQ